MQKRILIPTDFNVESLNTLKRALESFDDGEVEAVLFYSEYLSDSITDMLFYNPEKRLNELITPVFEEALTILVNRYEKLCLSVNIELFHYNNTTALQNFAEAREIDLIFVPKSYKLNPLKNGFDPIPAIKNSNIPLQEVSWENNAEEVYEDSLGYLFI
ncbi:MAG TPA: hypothetical protein PKD18_23155 [Saprospiraceae bacterium]|nr:hypothetical protein [Saprospiraceae bacterium]